MHLCVKVLHAMLSFFLPVSSKMPLFYAVPIRCPVKNEWRVLLFVNYVVNYTGINNMNIVHFFDKTKFLLSFFVKIIARSLD